MTDEEDRADELYHFAYKLFYTINPKTAHENSKSCAVGIAEFLREEHIYTNDQTNYGRRSIRMRQFYDNVIEKINEL